MNLKEQVNTLTTEKNHLEQEVKVKAEEQQRDFERTIEEFKTKLLNSDEQSKEIQRASAKTQSEFDKQKSLLD